MNRITRENFTYIVKSRTGKMVGFATEAEAVAEAKRRSNARACFVVYKDGKAIHSFMNKKELTNWVSVYKFVDENRRSGNVVTKGDRDTVPLEHSIDIAPGKVRICYCSIKYYRHQKGTATKIAKYSVVFHTDGRILVHNEGKLETTSAKEIHLALSYEEKAILVRELIKIRPELDGIINREEVKGWDIPGVFSKPNYYFRVDTYKGTAEYRDLDNSKLFKLCPTKLVNDSELIASMADKAKIPATKAFRRLYAANIMNIRVALAISCFGFKDQNNFGKVTNLGRAFLGWVTPEETLFVKKLIELRGENNAARMIQDTKISLIADTLHMYQYIDEEVSSYVIREARNIEEIHDTFCLCRMSRKLVNREIKYEEGEIARYNYTTTDGVSFSLAKDTKELAIIGAEMGICVGSYGDEVVRHHTTIVKAMKGNKYIACIEVKENDLVQLKAKYNNAVQLEYKNAVDEWIAHAKVCAMYCDDYRNIGRSWCSNYNYAHIDPNAFTEPGGTLRIVKATHKPVQSIGWLAAGENPFSDGFVECDPDDEWDHDRF